MAQLITDIEQVTPAWLTDTLRRSGVLDRGRVAAVRKTPPKSTITSLISRLELSYSADAPPTAPAHLFLKYSNPAFNPPTPAEGEHKEVAFYHLVAKQITMAMADPPVIRCYDAHYSPETGKGHLLLDDLSETHFQTPWPLPPLKLQCEQVMDCVANLHAFVWEDPRLGQEIGQRAGRETLEGFVGQTAERFAGFADFMGDRLPAHRRRIYEQFLSSSPNVWVRHQLERQRTGRSITLIHGDAHFWSFLYPHDPERDRVYLIDWQFWDIGIGTDDLAYMIALHWFPERRQALEKDLLQRYHKGLLEQGVEDYGWKELWYDYRMSALGNLLVPICQWAAEISPEVWWPHLERAMLAFHDLQCGELLQG